MGIDPTPTPRQHPASAVRPRRCVTVSPQRRWRRSTRPSESGPRRWRTMRVRWRAAGRRGRRSAA